MAKYTVNDFVALNAPGMSYHNEICKITKVLTDRLGAYYEIKGIKKHIHGYAIQGYVKEDMLRPLTKEEENDYCPEWIS